MKSFEERMGRLEEINQSIRQGQLPLTESVKLFEEGIQLSRSLEKELSQMEQRVEILKNSPDPDKKEEEPELELFDSSP